MPSPPPVPGALAATLDSLLSSPTLAGDQVGFLLLNSQGAVAYARNPDERFEPASCRKILSTACVLSLLGTSERIPTRVIARGRVSGSVLHGDIVLVGGGDPSLDDNDLAQLAMQVYALGIRRITGRVVGDGHVFEPTDSYPLGWSADDLPWYYAPPISGLVADEDRIAVQIRPGSSIGRQPVVTVAPHDAPYVSLQRTDGSQAGGAGILDPSRIRISLSLADGPGGVRARKGSDGIVLEGRVASETSFILSAPRPARYAADRFHQALQAAGIEVESESRAPGPDPDDSLLATHLSAPLSDLVARTNKPSDNLYAEMLLRQLAVRRLAHDATGSVIADSTASVQTGSTASVPASDTPDAKGAVLDRALGIESSWLAFAPGTYRLVDGSGLSRYDLLTPRQIAKVLLRMRSDPEFVASLPVAGQDGTMARRLAGTPAAGQVRAKTGSMSGVSTLAGYVGDRWILVFMDNGHIGSLDPVRKVEDAICLALAGGTQTSTPRAD